MKTFLSEEMRERRTDILCSVKIKNGGERLGLLFLLEHRSHQGRDIHQTLLNHQASAYRKFKMPIVPILAYSGKKPKWEPSLDFHGSLSLGLGGHGQSLLPRDSLGEAAAEVWEAIKGHVLNFRYFLLNLRELDEGRAEGLISHPALFILKHIWDLKEGWKRAERIIGRLLRLGENLSLEDWKALIKKALDYIHKFDPRFNWEVVRKIDEKFTGGKHTMLLSEPLKRERKKGRQEGRQAREREVILNMLQKKFDISVISEVIGLPEAEVIRFKDNGLKS